MRAEATCPLFFMMAAASSFVVAFSVAMAFAVTMAVTLTMSAAASAFASEMSHAAFCGKSKQYCDHCNDDNINHNISYPSAFRQLCV